MLGKACYLSLFVIIFNFIITITAISGETGNILRFIPFVSYVINFSLSVFLIVSGKIKKDRLTTPITLLFIINIISSIIFPSGDLGILMSLLMSTYWITTYIIFSYIINKKYDKKKIDKVILAVFYTLAFFFLFGLNSHDNSIADVLIGNNNIYYPLLMLPWVATLTSQKKKWVTIIILAILTVLSLKRTAIIIIVGAILVLLIMSNKSKEFKSKSVYYIAIPLSIIVIALIYMPNSPLADVMTRFESIEDDKGNGRLDIYADVIMIFNDQTTSHKIFGSGYRHVQETLVNQSNYATQISAHNDFLEILYDYGYFGLIIYLFLHIRIIKRAMYLYKKKSKLASPYISSYLIFLIMATFSHLIIYPTYFLLLVTFWAYSEKQIQQIDSV